MTFLPILYSLESFFSQPTLKIQEVMLRFIEEAHLHKLFGIPLYKRLIVQLAHLLMDACI